MCQNLWNLGYYLRILPAAKKLTIPKGMVNFLAAGEGFEPSQTESESGVLPLHKPAICLAPKRIIIIYQNPEMSTLK